MTGNAGRQLTVHNRLVASISSMIMNARRDIESRRSKCFDEQNRNQRVETGESKVREEYRNYSSKERFSLVTSTLDVIPRGILFMLGLFG